MSFIRSARYRGRRARPSTTGQGHSDASNGFINAVIRHRAHRAKAVVP